MADSLLTLNIPIQDQALNHAQNIVIHSKNILSRQYSDASLNQLFAVPIRRSGDQQLGLGGWWYWLVAGSRVQLGRVMLDWMWQF